MDSRSHFLVLDTIRGLGAIIILIAHIGQRSGYQPLPKGYLLVDFFFLLSGFVIAFSYEPRLAKGLSVARFAEVRAIRIMPTAFLGALIGLAAAPVIGQPLILSEIVLQLLLVPNLWASTIYPLNGPLWSIFFELVTNLAHVLVLRRLSERQLLVLTVVLGATFLAVMMKKPDVGADWGYIPMKNFLVGFVRTGFSYCIGILICRRYVANDKRLPQRWWILPVLIFCIVPAAPRWIPNPIVDVVALGVVFPVALWVAVRADLPQRLFGIGFWLSAISFPLYAIQMPLLQIVQHRLPHQSGWAWVFYGIVMMGLATLAAHGWDKPIRRVLSRKRPSRARPVMSGAFP